MPRRFMAGATSILSATCHRRRLLRVAAHERHPRAAGASRLLLHTFSSLPSPHFSSPTSSHLPPLKGPQGGGRAAEAGRRGPEQDRFHVLKEECAPWGFQPAGLSLQRPLFCSDSCAAATAALQLPLLCSLLTFTPPNPAYRSDCRRHRGLLRRAQRLHWRGRLRDCRPKGQRREARRGAHPRLTQRTARTLRSALTVSSRLPPRNTVRAAGDNVGDAAERL